MKKLTKKQQKIIENLNPKCEDCIHYLDNNGPLMCYFMQPFLVYKETARIRPYGETMNCGTEGRHFSPKSASKEERGI